MALTPEDVVNKRFQPTKFREGYDQDEVDDFLDEIVVELRRLNQENDELRRKVSELQSGDSATATAPADAKAAPASDAKTTPADTAKGATPAVKDAKATAPVSDAKTTPAEQAKGATPAAKDAKATAVPAAAAGPTVVAAAPTPGHETTATSAANVLAMAQKLHDDYVAEGEAQREQIIADANTEATGLVNDAQEKSRKTLAELEEKKSVLERKVEQLKGFERDYRSRLKAYIEGQLRDLQNQGPLQDETAGAAAAK
jgi:DivIVA domain-containing protein